VFAEQGLHLREMAAASSASCGWPAGALASLVALAGASASCIAYKAGYHFSSADAWRYTLQDPFGTAPCSLVLTTGVWLAFASTCGAGSPAARAALVALLLPLILTSYLWAVTWYLLARASR
jgi:hypothetical protein